MLPPSRRAHANENMGDDGGLEMAAIAWSYAAAIHLEIPPAVVFHEAGYRGGSKSNPRKLHRRMLLRSSPAGVDRPNRNRKKRKGPRSRSLSRNAALAARYVGRTHSSVPAGDSTAPAEHPPHSGNHTAHPRTNPYSMPLWERMSSDLHRCGIPFRPPRHSRHRRRDRRDLLLPANRPPFQRIRPEAEARNPFLDPTPKSRRGNAGRRLLPSARQQTP